MLAGLGLGIAMGAVVFFGGTRAGSRAERSLPPSVGSPAADFQLRQLSGETIRLSDLRGKPVVVNFWATWCPPCREEMPLLEATAQRYGDRLVVVGVDYAEDAQTVQAFVDALGITFPIALDSDGDTAARYYVRSYPATFFIDSGGVLRAQHMGALTGDLMDIYLATVGITQ